jgi:phosphoserine phosphatase
VAIGDSPADRLAFEYAGVSIAINPRGGVEAAGDYVIQDDLAKAIDIIEQHRKDP